MWQFRELLKYIRAEAEEDEGPYSAPLGQILTLKDIKRGHCFAGVDPGADGADNGSGEGEVDGEGLGIGWGLGMPMELGVADY